MPRLTDARWDFIAGQNSSYSEDALENRELRQSANCRLTTYGAVSKRNGTQRIHSDALGASVLGLVQWDNPSQSAELVAIADADLWHKTLAATTWTNVASTLSTTNRVSFATYVYGGTNRLYFADGSLRKWTATTLTTSISGAPSAKYLAVYKERLFASDGSKVIYWSAVADPETWAAPDGGQANVETYDNDNIVGLAVVGGSLLIFKHDSIARFQGTTADTIDIDKGTEGVSASVGCIAPGTIVTAEDFAFFLSDRGPYIATEGGVQPIGQKIESEMADWDHANWGSSWAVFNKDAREIWLIVPTDAVNDIAWCYNVRTQSWTGPWDWGFNVITASTFERTDGTEGVLLGGSDGYVRDGDNSDNGAKDDVLVGDTGGTNVTMTVEFPPFLLGSPGTVKLLHATQYLHADLGASGSVTASGTGEERGSASTFAIASDGAGTKAYRFWLAWRGRRPKLVLTEATSNQVTITGMEVTGDLGRRTA